MRSVKVQVSILVILLLGLTGTLAMGNETVTLRLPESILAEVLAKSLPILIEQPDGLLSGNVAINSIDQLRLADRTLSALIGLTGTDLQVSTTVAGHQLRLNIGSVDMDFALSASLRYDQAQRTLFVVPQVSELDQKNTSQANETGALLAGLFNGREFPIAIDRLQPLVTVAGDKRLTIDLQVEDVLASPQALVLSLKPTISAAPAKHP
ncbi:MAG: hypothetical protein IH612_02525 [Desulfofustis sp.]|nr:hypothetical protein [Desulfofustis sp.]